MGRMVSLRWKCTSVSFKAAIMTIAKKKSSESEIPKRTASFCGSSE